MKHVRKAMKLVALPLILALVGFAELAYGVPSPVNFRVLNPGITAEPQNQAVIAGESATFSVTAVGDAPLSYQWTFKGLLVGSNSSTYTRANCQLADDDQRVRVTVSNGKGSVLSSAATLTVSPNGTTYYVATNGLSSNTGLSTNSPWPLQYALNQLGAGITISVMPGLYTGQFYIDTLSGTATNPATVRSQYKWQAVLANATNDQFVVWNCNYIVLDGFCVSNSAFSGIALTGDYNAIMNCWVVNNGKVGINTSSPGNSNNIVENCLIELSGHGVWDGTVGHRWHGLYISGPNNTIRNNLIKHNAGYGIHLYTGYGGVHQNNNLIYNNLIHDHTNFSGVTVWGADGSGLLPGTNYIFGNTILDGLQIAEGTTYVTNNIILPSVANPTYAIANYVAAPAVLRNDYNLSTHAFVNDSGVLSGAHDIVTNYIGFVKTNSGLYWIKSDSPARGGARSTVFGEVDFFGNAQSSVADIGAFQYKVTLVGDTRVLDPSPSNPDYWSLP